jgi:hypothetical protein
VLEGTFEYPSRSVRSLLPVVDPVDGLKVYMGRK